MRIVVYKLEMDLAVVRMERVVFLCVLGVLIYCTVPAETSWACYRVRIWKSIFIGKVHWMVKLGTTNYLPLLWNLLLASKLCSAEKCWY